MKRILVTGAEGQLGRSLEKIHKEYPNMLFSFTDIGYLDITGPDQVKEFFAEYDFDYCINCAAYTNVEKAEDDQTNASLVNEGAVALLAKTCKEYGTTLIHISTDFIFDGNKRSPYYEEDTPNPVNFYGKSKYAGEQQIREILDTHYIIRTSWLYSEYGKNFMTKMLDLSKRYSQISVVYDQKGSPTYAGDLAVTLLLLIVHGDNIFGTYHYCNQGETSWFGFAEAIFKEVDSETRVVETTTLEFGAKAKRPRYSVLNTSKIEKAFGISIPHWRESLQKAIANYDEGVS